MSDNWSHKEVEATVSDYFEMLVMELRGDPFNKAEHNRNLQKLLTNRSKGAIEKKHQNISAVLIELGYPYIDGYKPLGNYQELLYGVVEERLIGAVGLSQAAAAAVEERIETPPIVSDVLAILVSRPSREQDRPKLYDPAQQVRRPGPVRRNYLEMESRNQTLGLAGEKLVLEFEHKRLWQAGKMDLANRVEHVADTTGDHLGFDIKSFETDGRDRLIEVKTTRFGPLTPFFASKNEVEVSDTREAEYQLYRLFRFAQQPKLFVLPGSLRKTCSLDPIQFSAMPV
ncbi:MAG: DUF3883 domain-containing protein [Verrucomicrobia bacterium]|nr:DUF3883 domain-containing protein [Verrucomicrobiota bacterium]